MPKATAPPTAQRDALAAKSEKSLQMSGLLAKIKDPSVGDLRNSVIDAASNKEGAIDRADFERLAAAIKEEAVADYEAKQAMVAKLGRSKNRVRYFGGLENAMDPEPWGASVQAQGGGRPTFKGSQEPELEERF